MSTHDSAFAYRQSSAIGGSPVGQVVALYDTILRDLRRAMSAMEAGNVEKRVVAVNHALVVIGELQGVLDFEHGGEPARHLEDFYKVARTMVMQGSVTNSRETLQEVAAMIMRIRSAWSQIESTVPTSGPVERVRISSPGGQAGLAKNDSSTTEDLEMKSESTWSA
jgi:flagellar secretion chaperone FliS